MDSVAYKVFLGDAWTEAAKIEMVPLPAVETQLTPIPPRYASNNVQTFDPAARQASVLEGTTLRLKVECTNKKPLASVWMQVKSRGQTQRLDLTRHDASGLVWSLAESNSPLANIRSEVSYEIQVVDQDQLSLDNPIRGTIRIRPDRPPTVAAEVVHKVVLPTAEPVIEYRATDDYGLSRIALLAQVERNNASASASPPIDLGEGIVAAAQEIPAEIHRFDLLSGKPVLSDRLPLASRYSLSLSSLKLAKGDRLKLTLEATDYRGENARGEPVGHPQVSESLVLEISDESGVLAAVGEADPHTDERLTDIIKRQLGIGESP
jgi:hypothetical protein